MRLIDADALIDKTDDRYSLHEIGRRERDDIVDALEYAPTVTPEPHWIPVTERLPGKNGEYIVTIQCEHVDGWDDYVTGFAEWDVDDWHLVSYYPGQIKAVAYMPLPEPYKGVTE